MSSVAQQALRINYDLLYKETPVLDFMYDGGIDPKEDGDYNKFIVSPYTLIRISDTVRSKNILLTPGYYLVKPEKRNGYNFLLFKQNGRIAGVVPVYQKVLINPLLVYKEPPKPKIPLYKKILGMPMKLIKWPFKFIFRNKVTPLPPKSALEYKIVGDGKYMEMWLYVGTYLYKVLFLIQ